MTALPPAGWFPDPETGGRTWRWWDGAQWAPPGYGYGAYDPAALAHELARRAESSRNTGKWFRGLMVAQAVGLFLFLIGIAVFAHHLHFPHDNGNGAPFARRFVAFQLLSVPFSFISWGYTAAYIAWLFTAGKFADLLPWPTRRSRALGAFSVLIPILNFWWPYEAICDFSPPGERPPVALNWFVAQLVLPILSMLLVGIASVAVPSGAVVAIVVMLGGVLAAVPPVLGLRLVDDVDAMQREHLAVAV